METLAGYREKIVIIIWYWIIAEKVKKQKFVIQQQLMYSLPIDQKSPKHVGVYV